MVNLYANFSKYLLISASRRPGYLPANLQGLWNCYMDPPWGSKYTVNINAQMNYWPVNISNLSECEIPLFNLLERAYENGKIVAAGCFLPLSEQFDIKKTFGTRHRAALGLAEQTDAVVLVVSEETGAISLAYDSKLYYDLSINELTKTLEELLEITSDSQQIEDTIDEYRINS